MGFKVTIKPCPCEQFRQAGHDAVAATVDPAEQNRANAAVALAEQLVFQAASGQQDTRYGATITCSTSAGRESLTVKLTAKPVPTG